MISDADLPELADFRRAERQTRFESDEDYGPLVVAGTNESAAVHRWFRFKESFSADFLHTILAELNAGKELCLLDPFCGVGTSLVAAQELRAHGFDITATGIERNPFIQFVAKTKVSWPRVNAQVMSKVAAEALGAQGSSTTPVPQNSSFTTARCMTRHVSRRLMAIVASIRSQSSGPTRDALLLGVAAGIEALSRTRKDGRALRLVEKPRADVAATLQGKWDAIVQDVALMKNAVGRVSVPRVVKGDGRRSLLSVEPESQDLVLTSPPYPNNIDYTEVYKLELWLLGHVTTADEFLALRRKTFRSHPTSSCDPPDEAFIDAAKTGRLGSLLKPVLARIRAFDEPWRKRLVEGYFSDIWVTLEGVRQALRPGGHAVFVVGNSLHGTSSTPYLIPTDLVLGSIAERLGFRLERTISARSLKRRLSGNHFLRESVIVLRKPRG